MKIGIIGLPQTGKTTLFGALTKGTTQPSLSKTNLAAVGVADADLEYLSSVFKPKKTTPASVEFADVPGIPSGQENASRRNELLKDVKNVDALVEVFDAFTERPSASALKDEIESFELDLALVDLEIVEHRLERMNKEKMTPVLEKERELLTSAQACLSGGKALRTLGMSDDDKRLLTSYAFITLKPVMYAVNITMTDEASAMSLESDLTAAANQVDATVMVLDAKLEREIAELPASEQREFLQEFGLSGSAIDTFVNRAYRLLKLQTFYTAGDDECKAWVIDAGTNARGAAGKIHTDIARGFIAAEVISLDDFRKADSSFKVAKEKGLLRIEGESYIVKDKEIAHFRFNVSH
jgi:GTP-binding protein YchF